VKRKGSGATRPVPVTLLRARSWARRVSFGRAEGATSGCVRPRPNVIRGWSWREDLARTVEHERGFRRPPMGPWSVPLGGRGADRVSRRPDAHGGRSRRDRPPARTGRR
jgi:hypothetical protein